MSETAPTYDVMRHTFGTGLSTMESDARMQPIAECICELRRTLDRLTPVHGTRPIMWALIVLIVDAALESGDAELAATALRSNARLLELHAGVDVFGTQPQHS